jgi:hypothetical protein
MLDRLTRFMRVRKRSIEAGVASLLLEPLSGGQARPHG